MDGSGKRIERDMQRRAPHDKHKVPAGRNMLVDLAHCFTCAPLGAVTVVCFPKLFTYHKSTARAPDTIAGRIQTQQRMRPGSAFTTYPPKLVRPA